jgi:hypothetical protein
MKRSSNKFLHRVRIHGGEFDASARAMHRDGMTSSFQAAVETVSIATNERKQMSTKTTFKRVALVAVAALGFGLLSVVPSNATASAGNFVLSSTAATQQTGETATATSATATLSYSATAVTDTVTITASLYSAVSATGAILTTGLAQPKFDVVETTSAQVQSDLSTVILSAADRGASVSNDVAAVVVPASSGVAVAKIRVWLNGPTTAGTYVVKLTPAIPSGSTAGSLQAAAAVTLTITVTTNPALDTVAKSATVVINKGETSSATTDATVTHSKALTTGMAAAATISVGLLNAAGVATTGESYTATISGPGSLGSGADSGDPISGPAPTGRAITVKAGHVVQVFADGSSGVATITIGAASGAILATKKMTFFGATTKLTASVVKPVIGLTATAGTILVKAEDAAGTEVQDASINVFSSAPTIANGTSYTACGSYSATNGTAGAGYLCSVTGVAAGLATITPTTKTSAADTTATAVTGTGVSIRVGSTKPASVSVTTDKATYIPGEKATITVVLLDSTGLTLADGTYTSIFATGGITANYTLGSGSDTTTATSVDGFASGVKTFTVFMPTAETTVKFSWTTGSVDSAAGAGLATANQAVDGSVSVGVISSSGSAATDAANEATDAANAATDAANAAAEAADAATAAAQDAADAVAALSTEVASLIAALKAQITSLTNLVIKIQKKVKA